MRDAVTGMAGEPDPGVLVTGVLYLDPGQVGPGRLLLDLGVQLRQRQQRRRSTGSLYLALAAEQVVEKATGVVAIAGDDAGRHDHGHEDHQAAVADHQVERQHQHANGVMPVEPGTLALARTEGEEVLEDFLVGDDAADQRDKHHHGCKGRQPAAPRIRHLQLKVEAVEELATPSVAALHLVAGLRVEEFFRELAARTGLGWRLLPAHRQAGITGTR
ncbi:hypothetical protein D9M71_378300 [compost metagenome]